jgi:hypothetical protein
MARRWRATFEFGSCRSVIVWGGRREADRHAGLMREGWLQRRRYVCSITHQTGPVERQSLHIRTDGHGSQWSSARFANRVMAFGHRVESSQRAESVPRECQGDPRPWLMHQPGPAALSPVTLQNRRSLDARAAYDSLVGSGRVKANIGTSFALCPLPETLRNMSQPAGPAERWVDKTKTQRPPCPSHLGIEEMSILRSTPETSREDVHVNEIRPTARAPCGQKTRGCSWLAEGCSIAARGTGLLASGKYLLRSRVAGRAR